MTADGGEGPPRERRLIVDGVECPDASDAAVRALLADHSAGCAWRDLPAGDPANGPLLADVFGIHPLAVEDAEAFGQRPEVEDFDDYLYLVVFAAGRRPGRLAEIHIFYSERFLVTVHRDECPALAEIRHRLPAHGPGDLPPGSRSEFGGGP